MEKKLRMVLEKMCKDAFVSGWECGVNWMSSSIETRVSFDRCWKEFLEKEFNNENKRTDSTTTDC